MRRIATASIFVAAALNAHAADPAPTLHLRLDFRSVTSPEGAGQVSAEKGLALFRQVNAIWAQCGIQFILRRFGAANSRALAVSYPPQSADDLSVLAKRLNPNGFDGAIPLTIAGPWSFAYGNVLLNGLGWVTTTASGGVEKIGAMMSSKKVDAPEGGLILAHELGHALSLPEGGDGTIMGPGTPVLSAAQCAQTRGFAEKYLGEFRVANVLQARATR